RVFWSLALVIGVVAVGVWIRFAVAYADGNGSGHVQSLILGAVLFIAAVVLWALGVLGDLLAAQRVMTQQTLERVRPLALQVGVAPAREEGGAPARGELAPVAAAGQADPRRFARGERRPGSDDGSPETERLGVGSPPETERPLAGSAPPAGSPMAHSAP